MAKKKKGLIKGPIKTVSEQREMFGKDEDIGARELTPAEEFAYQEELKNRRARVKVITIKRGGRKRKIKVKVPKMYRFTCTVERQLAERVRDCVFWLSAPIYGYTITKFATEAMELHLARLAKRYRQRAFTHGGMGWEPRKAKLRSGRPVKRPGRADSEPIHLRD